MGVKGPRGIGAELFKIWENSRGGSVPFKSTVHMQKKKNKKRGTSIKKRREKLHAQNDKTKGNSLLRVKKRLIETQNKEKESNEWEREDGMWLGVYFSGEKWGHAGGQAWGKKGGEAKNRTLESKTRGKKKSQTPGFYLTKPEKTQNVLERKKTKLRTPKPVTH